VMNQEKKGIDIDPKLLTDTIILKRLVMKRCVYGVDINPLAVELAKLSLWLDSFTIGVPLTFLDHHIRCGDSLIGLRIDDIRTRAVDDTLDAWTDRVTMSAKNLQSSVSTTPDLTKEQVEQSRRNYEKYREDTKPQRSILDLMSAGILDKNLADNVKKNITALKRALQEGKKLEWWSGVEQEVEVADKYRAFHWELEFPEAFASSSTGFDLVVMNPPWEVFMPEDDDFFSVYYSKFRVISAKPQKRKIMQDLLKTREVLKAYESYRQRIEQCLSFFRESGYYSKSAGANPNLWKLFLERALQLVSRNGTLSIVLPSGIVTDEGAKKLRMVLFSGRIRSLYEFENKNGIFPDVHRGYKFVLLSWDNSSPAAYFPAAFYLHSLKALEMTMEQEKFVEMPSDLPSRFSPDTLSIPEVRNKLQLQVLAKLHMSHCLLNDPGKGWNVKIIREFNRTDDSDLFHTERIGWPLMEGKCFHQFIPDYDKPTFYIDREDGFKRLGKRKDSRYLSEKMHNRPRLAFRLIASSTNVRTMVACILPPKCWLPNLAPTVIPEVQENIPEEQEYARMLSYLSAIFNSFVFDFIVRTKISTSLNYFYVYQSPVPSDYDDAVSAEIVELAARLSSCDNRYEEFASLLKVKIERITMKEQIEFTAKLNALVAKKYGINREDLQLILNSFEGFEEDEKLSEIQGEVSWSDSLIRKFNGEVRKRVMGYFDKL
jgi:hypothetical protein